MNFSLAQLEAFAATYESGSFKVAAERINKRRQVITKLVCAMEESCNVELFERKTRHLQPTDAAHKLFPFVNRALVDSGKIRSTIRRFELKPAKKLSLGIDSMLICSELIDCFQGLLDEFPELELDIHTGSTTEVFDWLAEKKVELALRFYPFFDEAEVIKVMAFNFEMVNVASAKLINDGAVLSEDELAHMTQIVPKFVYHYHHQKQHVFSDKTIQSNNLQQTISMIEAGMGWTVVPKFMVQKQLEDGSFSSLMIEGSSPIFWAAELIYLSEDDLSFAGDSFIQQVQEIQM
ncbi:MULTISPECIES: LysR family transcriptional regulator [unclassified Agarivorans]|uniref:LysR family transcriptional regulator n=1 Tax=unclassified Agarivorans TaxID=2636026 RepID=UPI0026E43698|nr:MULTISPECIES: LysR family transcriptional regulator [unclassified Agarivorans]MDO6684464.1 LysR family transcriptional regulator [Agarivorans sp. 3_MG-2023]MDO6714629.1 LysR family transcriptional regulator [Agarivorans sp. 2_MG-2023]